MKSGRISTFSGIVILLFTLPISAGTWSQTSQEDFDLNTQTGIDIYASPGDAQIVEGAYSTDSNTILLMHFNEGSWNATTNEVLDSSGQGNHGTASGDATTTDGKFGRGGSFDGINDVVDCGDLNNGIEGITELTVSAWVYPLSPNADAGPQVLISKLGDGNDTFFVWWTTAEDIEFRVYKAIQWRFEKLKDDRTDYNLFWESGIIQEALYFGGPIEYIPGTSPRIVPILEDEKDIENLQIPELEDVPGVKWFYEQAEKFKKIAKAKGIKLPISDSVLTIHPPLSAACAIMGPTKVYTLLYTNPSIIKIFLDKMLEAYIKLKDYADKRLEIKTTSIGLGNDNSCFISNKMYCEQVLPYDKKIYERYGKDGRYLHTDGPSDHNFKTFANELKITFMDIGGFSSMERAVKDMKGKVVIHGGLNCKDLYNGLTENTKNKILEAIRLAAPGGGYEFAIGGETYPGISPETLIELVAYVKKVGRYPIERSSENYE